MAKRKKLKQTKAAISSRKAYRKAKKLGKAWAK